jgi:ATP-dependent Clp protease adaptor protein ClpS
VSATLVMEKNPTHVKNPVHTAGGKGFGAKTILFNDDFHTFEEVAHQLVKAIRCTYAQGMTFANEVHTTGRAVVYSGHVERCEAVAMVLEQIRLRVNVER